MTDFIVLEDGNYFNLGLIRNFVVLENRNKFEIRGYFNEFDDDGFREFIDIASHFSSEEAAFQHLESILKNRLR